VLNKQIRILNFDDSVIKQKNLFSQYENNILDLKDIGPQARYWMNAQYRSLIERRISNSAKDSVAFLGSGDFHHISELLISQFSEPISVIIFDFHPDWDVLPPRLGCGSWVSEVLKKKNVLKVILLGVSSGDINSFDIQTGNLDSLRNDRVEIYPYAHKPSKAFLKKIPKNISVTVNNGVFFSTIYWKELKNVNLADFFPQILNRIPTKNIYISIDKDCLKGNYALTNWEEGCLSLEELLLIIKLIKENLDIVGLDIIGDHSKICIENRFKRILSYLDHPRNLISNKFSESAITAINENTNLKILESLCL